MSSSEISCSSCNFIFNDNQLYNIHLKTCASNHNTDPKNKYYCPICNRQFRLLSNLLRHNETRKHQELLEWNVNKMSSSPNTNNVKTISVNLTDEELEATSKKSQSKTFDLDIEEKPDTFSSSPDPFLSIYNQNTTYPEQITPSEIDTEPIDDEPDNFLQNLIKEREKEFASFTTINTNPTPNNNTQQKEVKEKPAKSKTKIVGFTIQEDDGVNLKNEIEKAKEQLNVDIVNTEVEDDEQPDALLNNIQALRTSKMNNLTAKLDVSKKINSELPSESKNQPQYPTNYHDLPLWKNLQVIVKNSQAPRLLVSLLISTPLNDYPKICTFVYFSKELKENKELKLNMVKTMIEVKNHLNQLFSKRQTVWNGKHIPLTLALMNKWKLDDFVKTIQ